jgi:hypothetical protein
MNRPKKTTRLVPLGFVTLSLCLSVTFLSCDPERLQYTRELKSEMSEKKPKRVTNAQLNEAVNSWGEQIVAVAQTELIQKLKEGGDHAALCRLENLPKTTALAERYGLTISLLGAADIQNPKLAAKEREVLDAYLYNAEKKIAQQPNIQKIADTMFVYNAAVPTENAICQTCFGTQKTPLAVWRLAFTKRELVKRLNLKKK